MTWLRGVHAPRCARGDNFWWIKRREVHAPRCARGDIHCRPERSEGHAPWFLLFLLLYTAPPAHAQSALTDYVRESAGRPLGSAEVTVDALSMRVVTDENGRYRMPDVPTCAHLVRVRLLGYAAAAAVVQFSPNLTSAADFTLHRLPQILDTVVVKDRSHIAGVGFAAFEERRCS